jgi:hypothetical protein
MTVSNPCSNKGTIEPGLALVANGEKELFAPPVAPFRVFNRRCTAWQRKVPSGMIIPPPPALKIKSQETPGLFWLGQVNLKNKAY